MQHRSRIIRFSVCVITVVVLSSFHGGVIAQTPTPLTACGVIDESGSYVITRDLTTTSGDCFTIQADSVSIDGSGHSVSSTGRFVSITAHSNISISNVTANDEIYITGDHAGPLTISQVNVAGVSVFSADDVTVRDSTLQYLSAVPIDRAEPVYRLTVQRNTFNASDVLKMLYLVGGTTIENQTEYVCADSNFLIEDNTITSHWPETVGDEPLALTIRCARHSIVRRNTITTTGKAVGIYLRDQSDYGTYENNVIDVSQSWAGSIIFASGLEACTAGTQGCPYGRPEPGDPGHNTFTGNIFRARESAALYMGAPGPGNTFQNNYFYTDSDNNLPTTVSEDVIGGAQGSTFIHNTFYRANDGNLFRFAVWESSTTANTFRDNIFSYSGTWPYGFDHTSCDDIKTKYIASNNVFNNRAGAVTFGSCGETLAIWKTKTAGRDANSIEGNPRFTDPTTFNFSLQNNSPALNAASDGTNIGAWQTPVCSEDWHCGSWSICAGGMQTRTCTDANNCGTTASRPAQSQSCTMGDTTAPAQITNLTVH